MRRQTFTPCTIQCLCISPMYLQLTNIQRNRFLGVLTFINRQGSKGILLPCFRTSTFASNREISTLLHNVIFQYLMERISMIMSNIIRFHVVRLTCLGLLSKQRAILGIRRGNFRFYRPLLVFLVELLRQMIRLSRRQNTQYTFTCLAISTTIHRHRVRINMTIRCLLTIRVAIILHCRNVKEMFYVVMSPHVMRVLLVSSHTYQGRLRGDLRPLISMLHLTFQRNRRFKRGRPMTSNSIAIPISSNILHSNLSERSAFRVRKFILRLCLYLPSVRRDGRRTRHAS